MRKFEDKNKNEKKYVGTKMKLTLQFNDQKEVLIFILVYDKALSQLSVYFQYHQVAINGIAGLDAQLVRFVGHDGGRKGGIDNRLDPIPVFKFEFDF